MKSTHRAEIFPDGSVALIRDVEGVMEISVMVDYVAPEQAVVIDAQEYESLKQHRAADIRFDRGKKKLAISKPDPDTKREKDTQ